MGFILLADAQDEKSFFVKSSFTAKSGHVLPYRIAVPPNKSDDKKPLLVFLHGAGERGNVNEKQLTHGSSFLYSAAENFNAVVVAPQCASDSYWSSVDVDRSNMPLNLTFDYEKSDITPDLAAVMELVKSIKKTHNIDRKRIYVMGLSMGGMGTFEIVHRYPKCFAAAVPVCGGGDQVNYTTKAKKIPFWIMHGDADVVVDVSESRGMVKALEERNYKVRYTEYPGVNHNSWDNAFVEPNLLNWLFSNHR